MARGIVIKTLGIKCKYFKLEFEEEKRFYLFSHMPSLENSINVFETKTGNNRTISFMMPYSVQENEIQKIRIFASV